MALYSSVHNYLRTLSFETISEERKLVLQLLQNYIREQQSEGLPINLNFICTHNSRRSHLCQVWAQTIASYCNVNNVYSYSGGTEATAVYPMVLQTLQEVGFTYTSLQVASNSIYAIKYGDSLPPIIAFSKKYAHNFNPAYNFAAILTCSQADEGCPIVKGASKRIPITFEDPKAFDETTLQIEKYEERSRQIATELLFVFSSI